MRTASVSDLRYRFSKIEKALRNGEEIRITKRNRVVGRVLPPVPVMPDFLARMEKVFKGRTLKMTGAEIVAEGRDRY